LHCYDGQTRLTYTDGEIAAIVRRSKAECALLAADSDNMTTVVKRWRFAVREIQLKDAKASLSSVVDDATRGEPSIITRDGKPEAVVMGFEEWERLTRVPPSPGS
jgi:prevent-host-death family protein